MPSPMQQRAQRARAYTETDRSRCQLLLDHAHDAICVLDLEGRILEANRRWEEILELPLGELVGRRFSELVAEGGGSHAVPIRRPDRRTLLMDFTTSEVEIDGQAFVLSIGRDVTEQVRVASALRASEERLRGLIERLPDVVWSGTADGGLHFVGGNITSVCGITPQELYAMSADGWLARVHPEDRDTVERGFRAFLDGAPMFEHEYRWRHREGHWIWLRSRSTARYEVDGVVHYDGVFTDVTQQRHFEESLRQAQKMEAVGLLASGIAHDFNNLLAVIMADASFLASDLGPDDPRRAEAQEIEDTAMRAAALTRQLLMFSRKQVVQPEALAVGAVLDDLARMLRRVIGEDVKLSIASANRLGRIHFDRCELEQIILNLAVNARDAMPDGGALTIETESVEVDETVLASCVGAAAPGPHVLVTVTDTGCGISARVRERIFEPFFTTKPPGKGTGLGLSTVYSIVTHAGGAIGVDSEPGRGTRFRIYLPRLVAAAEERRGRGTVAPFLAGTERLLLVEDDDAVRAVARRILASAGYDVHEACDGAAAATLLDGGLDVDMVLTDVVMPTSSGPDLIAALRERIPPLAVLFMSGYSDHAALDDALDLDGASFLPKPFTPQGLLKKVREVLAAR